MSQTAQTEIHHAHRLEVLRRHQTREPAQITDDHGASAAQSLQRGSRTSKYEVIINEFPLGIAAYAAGGSPDGVELNTHLFARRLKFCDGCRFSERGSTQRKFP